MNTADWTYFIERCEGRILPIAQIENDLADKIAAVSNVVRISHTYAVKLITEHQLGPSKFPLLDETLDRGGVVQDGSQHLVFFYYDAFETERWYRATLKRCNEKRLLWLSTFHVTELRQVHSKMRRLPTLRPLK